MLIDLHQNHAMTNISLDSIQFYRSLVKTKSFHYEKLTTLFTRGFAKQVKNNSRMTKFNSVDHQQSTSFMTKVAIDQDAHFLEITKSNARRS